jgi:serpin B
MQPNKARKRINKWVTAATNNLIDSILDQSLVTKQTDLILANAIYFKGKWGVPFNKKYIKDGKFYLLDGSARDVPFMRSWKRRHIACHRGFKVLELYYESGKVNRESPHYSMCIFLPDARDGLPGLISDIVGTPGFITEHRPRTDVKVRNFRLPKFKIIFSKSVTGVLLDMGLQVAFQPGEADLSDMVKEEDDVGRTLALQQIVHKAVIEVNEKGTRAAAVTGGFIRGACAKRHRPRPIDFVANHPFAFFVIEYRSGAIMFAGHVLDPSKL